MLSEDERDALMEFIRLAIWTESHYYFTDGQIDMDKDGLKDIKETVDNWWNLYDRLVSGERTFYEYEYIRKVSINLEFEIFSVLYSEINSYEIDNPIFLYNLLSAWKKFNDYVTRYETNKKCECCTD